MLPSLYKRRKQNSVECADMNLPFFNLMYEPDPEKVTSCKIEFKMPECRSDKSSTFQRR